MIKSILGGKSKNLFDISKVITSNVVKRNGNSLICSSYGTSIGTLGSICPTLKPSDLITISFKCASEGFASNFMAFNGRTFPSGATFLVSEIGLSSTWYLYSTDYDHRDIPNKTTYSDIQIELGSTATEYVPHELTSYKSIMKVGNGHFVTSFDERMPCKTKNLFSSSTEVGVPSSTLFVNTSKRIMENGKWYVGFSKNNYYRGPQSDWPGNFQYNIWENSISIYTNLDGYGLAKCIYVEPNTSYILSYKVSGVDPDVGIGFYQEDGTFIKYFMGKEITTSQNCKFITVVFALSVGLNKVIHYFSDIQLVKGTTATDYVPYGYV